MKKNTLLYLEKSLVEKAKKQNLNISGITELALRNALENNADKPRYIFEGVNKIFLPYKIKSLTINKKRQKFYIVNIISDINNSEKRKIYDALIGKLEEDMILETSSIKRKTSNNYNECIVMDDGIFKAFKEKAMINFIRWLREKYPESQLIIFNDHEIEDIGEAIGLELKA